MTPEEIWHEEDLKAQAQEAALRELLKKMEAEDA